MDGFDTDGLEVGHDIDAGTDAGHETNIAHGEEQGMQQMQHMPSIQMYQTLQARLRLSALL